jgi:hypothetical protein
MANNKEEAGKGMPRPGEMPGSRRTYATIDLTASEVGGSKPASAPAASTKTPGGTASPAESKATEASAKTANVDRPGSKKTDDQSDGTSSSLGTRLLSAPWLSHMAAGALGAVLALIVIELLTPGRPETRNEQIGELNRRVAEVEGALGTRPGAGMRARMEELSRSVAALGETQAKLARETKAIDAKVGATPEVPPDLAVRIARVEETLNAAAAADPAAQTPQVAALAGKVAELEKAARSAAEAAKTGASRLDGELSALRTEGGRLAQRLDTLRGEIEERVKASARAADLAPLSAQLASLEREMQTFAKGETERAASAAANTTQMLLALELANLKRAVDRGQGFAEELDRAKRIGGFTANFAPLERYMREGAPTQPDLVKSFRRAADAMLDAETEKPDASLLDRVLSGARSVVRVRRVDHAADDTSLEAVIGRMETALKEGRLAEVLAEAKKLPPKAALAGEDWLKKVETRLAIEQAMAGVEAQIKGALGASKTPASEGKR